MKVHPLNEFPILWLSSRPRPEAFRPVDRATKSRDNFCRSIAAQLPSFQNKYTHKVTIFELLRELQLHLSGLFQIILHYSYSFLVHLRECSQRNNSPQGFSRISRTTVT